MKLLVNENVPLAGVRSLRDIGHDVVSITEDSPGISDEEVLRIARAEIWIIVTFDRDYGELVFRRRLPPTAGMLYLRFRPRSPSEIAEYFLRLTAARVDLNGRFTTAYRGRMRQRMFD